jgi:adenylate kinase
MRILLAVLLTLAANISWSAIGTVSDTKGTACSIERNKQKVGGEKGAGVEMNDTYITAGCVSNITFKDDTKVKITENSRLLIDDFVYDPKKSDAGKLVIKAAAGTVRYASGQIAKNNPQAVDIKTPTASIAVRGTDFTMTVDESGASLVVLLPSCKDEKDIKQYELQENVCKTGKIEVTTMAGMVVLDHAFQGTYILGSNIPPTPPRVLNIVENKINNSLILVKPIEIQRAIKDHQKTKQDKDKEQLEAEAQMELARAIQAANSAEANLIQQMNNAVVGATCNASTNICVRWQNPQALDINMRGQGTAYRSNQDNYAEVKTSGTTSNTAITIVHNDNSASMVIGDPGAILNTVYIKQNVGLAKVKN